ncbi:hypothetical protein M5C72_09050 [Companilactobacillus allii]|uniref:Uncharacterized protein n=1 Tax=Companilactobacillus allii TaxID=1847728 RepID=A0A1P8Q5R4_9LACO|nr:hypothetical protein [Companilactobacillus allii]APX73214.1 hypothetical protein BTM29_11940 [Companilactobacillus allii]USQ68024.1 hypothetical protein M5C72_09050 [Companilactobacillus allii]
MANVLILGNKIDASNLIDSESNTTIMDSNSINRIDLDNKMKDTNIIVVELDNNSSIDLIPTVVESMKVYQVKKIIVLNKDPNSKSKVIRISTEFLELSNLDYQIVNSPESVK